LLAGGNDSVASRSRCTPSEVVASSGWSPTGKEPYRCGGARFRVSSAAIGFAAGVVGTVLAYQSTPFVSNLGHALLGIWIGTLCGLWILWRAGDRRDRV
jgi:hypothetical protein